MGTDRAGTGRAGEDAACRYLEAQGHTIVARNWRGGHVELDIVSVDRKGALHFVEVKCRTAPSAADPQDNVGSVKQRRLTLAAKKFLNSAFWRDCPFSRGEVEMFFDVVSILKWPGRIELEYFPQAFIPMDF